MEHFKLKVSLCRLMLKTYSFHTVMVYIDFTFQLSSHLCSIVPVSVALLQKAQMVTNSRRAEMKNNGYHTCLSAHQHHLLLALAALHLPSLKH